MAAPMFMRAEQCFSRFGKQLYRCKEYSRSKSAAFAQFPIRWKGSDASNSSSSDSSKIKLDLAKPARSRKQFPKKAVPSTEPSQEEAGLDSNIVSAVNAVADALGSEQKTVRLDLLKKLQEHSDRTDLPKTDSVRSLLSGLAIEKQGQVKSSSKYSRRRDDTENGSARTDHQFGRSGIGSRTQDSSKESRPKWRDSAKSSQTNQRNDVKLFDGPDLGIFFAKEDSFNETEPQLNLFDIIEEEERQKTIDMPPPNAFHEMIKWTKEGKIWNFPIDNEQGMESEFGVGFHEHVFLNHLLNDFPKTGPIRNFMELVVVGLSKNAFVTVQEKHEHIAWYAKYFKDKYHLLDEPTAKDPTQELESKETLTSNLSSN